jgi:hypothetical protein
MRNNIYIGATCEPVNEKPLPNSKWSKRIKLKYPKTSLSRQRFGFEITRQVDKDAIRPSVAAKRYISSSSLTDRNRNFKVISQPRTKNQLYKRKIPTFCKETNKFGSVIWPPQDQHSIKSSVGGIKPIYKSMKPRSMSRSQLGGKENRKASLRYVLWHNQHRINSSITHSSKGHFQAINGHVTTNTYLPNLHNMSAASLLSGNDKQKQNSMLSTQSNYGSQKKLNFKVTAKTPSNYFGDRGSSIKISEDGYFTDQDKLKVFHARLEQHKFQLLQKHGNPNDLLHLPHRS